MSRERRAVRDAGQVASFGQAPQVSLATSREQIDVRWEETATKVVKIMHPPKVEHANLERLERAELHLLLENVRLTAQTEPCFDGGLRTRGRGGAQ